MKIPKIETGMQIFVLALALIGVVGAMMFIHPEDATTYLTFLGGVFTGFMAASLDLNKVGGKNVDEE